MPDKSSRVVVDVNIWLSLLISKKTHLIFFLLYSDYLSIIYSHELLTELSEVIKREKFSKYKIKEEFELLITLLVRRATLIKASSNIKLSRDEKDNYLLGLSKDGNADYLLTGDKDLLILEKHENTKIITVSEFVKLYS